jgi:hypothetical protein
MTLILDQACCACLPLKALPALASLRRLENIEATLDQERIWLRWPAGRDEVIREVFSVPGVKLFVREEGLWRRYGSRLPSFGLPVDSGMKPLYQLLMPAPFQPEAPAPPLIKARTLGLVPNDQRQETTALASELSKLAQWADRATSHELGSVHAACCEERVVLRGAVLPLLPGATRYWGDRLLIPIGHRPEPALNERALLEALGVTEAEIAILQDREVELIPRAAFAPVSRAGIRLAVQGLR